MSGKDERKPLVDLGYCSNCGSNSLTWRIVSRVPQSMFAMFNCTDTYGGPDYVLDGLFSDIKFFKCEECGFIFEPDTPKYQLLIRGLKRSPHVRDNPNRTPVERSLYERNG